MILCNFEDLEKGIHEVNVDVYEIEDVGMDGFTKSGDELVIEYSKKKKMIVFKEGYGLIDKAQEEKKQYIPAKVIVKD